ncbi:DnaJ domain-containing protein [Candidatus Sulfurimonas marisnigri]|uniref:DnaJ domain-containing protein n=1 Tax=Candidatus Sulfurimonas marisnigri TaxID=2740405 RepID=A0A7S7LYG2_9BACT|nr:DnaJ domain-containing protein [Candidatus Sulfurimonas marisnigri]QOY53783.1 DnaJ domain-containing protein [Candidatus Sulfurimonas marisnigri]
MKMILGLAIIALGVFLEFLWLGFCFGSIIIGILLLIFAPRILFFPFTFFLILGLSIINPNKYSRSSKFQYQRYSQGQTNYTQPQSNLDKYYKILESQKTDSFDVIKANYRRLMKEYHYDSLVSKDLSKDMLKFAEEKTQSINEAYAAIKDARG